MAGLCEPIYWRVQHTVRVHSLKAENQLESTRNYVVLSLLKVRLRVCAKLSYTVILCWQWNAFAFACLLKTFLTSGSLPIASRMAVTGLSFGWLSASTAMPQEARMKHSPRHGRTTIEHDCLHDWPGRLSGLCAKYRSKEERGIRAHHDLVQFINRNTQLSFDVLGLSGKENILVSWKTTEVRRHHKNLMCLVPPETLKFIIYWECWAPASEESLLFHIVWSVNAYQKWTKCLFQAAAETCMTSQLDLGRAETMDAKNLCMSTPVGRWRSSSRCAAIICKMLHLVESSCGLPRIQKPFGILDPFANPSVSSETVLPLAAYGSLLRTCQTWFCFFNPQYLEQQSWFYTSHRLGLQAAKQEPKRQPSAKPGQGSNCAGTLDFFALHCSLPCLDIMLISG